MSDDERSRGATSWDVAKLAGVSQSTVSLVLAGKAARRVRDETRAAVLQAAEELGYRPNSSARALKVGKQHLIALAAPNVSNPYFAAVLKSVAAAAEAQGYTTALINSGEDPPDGQGLIRSLTAHSFDGLIVWESPWAIQARAILPETVIVHDGDWQADASVHIPASQIIRSAVDYLVDRGHRHIARLGFDLPAKPFRARARAFHDYLAALGLPADEEFNIETPFGSTSSDQMTALFASRRRPTAVICDDDLLAPLVYRAAKRSGLSVPDHVSVIGIGDIDLAQLLEPPLTTVAIPARAVGEAAFAALLAKMNGSSDEAPVVVETYLVARGSVAIARQPVKEVR